MFHVKQASGETSSRGAAATAGGVSRETGRRRGPSRGLGGGTKTVLNMASSGVRSELKSNSESPSKVTDVPSRCHCARDTSGVGRLLIKITVGPSTVTVPDSLEDWPYPSTMAV